MQANTCRILQDLAGMQQFALSVCAIQSPSLSRAYFITGLPDRVFKALSSEQLALEGHFFKEDFLRKTAHFGRICTDISVCHVLAVLGQASQPAPCPTVSPWSKKI